MRTAFLSALALAATIGTAQAQTVFDGFYGGAGLGFGFGSVDNFDGAGSLDINGAAFSGAVGWNASSGNMVYGIEGDLSLGDISGNAPCANPAWDCSAKAKAIGTLRGRLGVAQNNVLFYVTAGGAVGSVELKTTNAGGTKFPDTQTATGWVAGLGVEARAGASPWSYRAEFLHHDFGTKTYMTDVPYSAPVKVDLLRFMMLRKF